MQEELQALVDRFNSKVKADPGLQEELTGMQRSVAIELDEGTAFHFYLKDQRLTNVEVGRLEKADVRLMSSEKILRGLLSGEVKPMKAWALKQLRVKASLEDLARLRKFF